MPQVMMLRLTDHGGYGQDDLIQQTLSAITEWQEVSVEDLRFLQRYWHKRNEYSCINILVEKIDPIDRSIIISELKVKLEAQIKQDDKRLAEQKKAEAKRIAEKEAKAKEKRQKTIGVLMKKYDINEVAAEQMIIDLKIKV